MTKHYNDLATLAERALDYSETVTGIAPVAAPTLITQGVDCRDLSSVIARVTADQATGLNCKLEIIPWLWGKTLTGTGAAVDAGWAPMPPVQVDCLVSQPLGQTFEVKCDAGDRIYFQITAPNAALAWATAEAFAGLRRQEVQPVAVHGLMATILAAMEQNKTPDFVQVHDVTNGVDGTHDEYIERKDGHHASGFQFVIDGGSGGVTCTIWISMQDDGTAPAACLYADVTNEICGAATVVATGVFFNEELLSIAKYIRVRAISATGGANDADWDIQYRSA